MSNPYREMPPRAFWRTGVAERHYLDIEGVAESIPALRTDRIGTAGSCFAQHIGRYLRESGANYLDLEPAPAFLEPADARDHGFGVYSCRYGNIYTARQLRQLAEEACGVRALSEAVWEKDGRFFDALRPSVDPVGHDRPTDVLALREAHLGKVRALLDGVDIFVFTLGLTEAWEAVGDGTVYPTAPGTVAGSFHRGAHRFHNFDYMEVREDLEAFWRILRERSPAAKLILTVSPVPLTATASGQHVLSATSYSKSTLRAVAGDMSRTHGIFYFPSYELISTHPSRAMFFNPDLRTVNAAGVGVLLKHLSKSIGAVTNQPTSVDEGVLCDEALLDQHAP